MSLSSLINTGLDNPPTDGDQPLIEEGKVSSPVAEARYAAFVKLADTTVDYDSEESPGARFSTDLINTANAAVTHKRLEDEAIATRREEAQAIEQQILDSDLTPEAAFGTIRDIREQLSLGTAPEDLAIQELSARNIQDAEANNAADIAYQQAVEDQEKYSTQQLLATLKGDLEQEFQSTIPGVEDAYEMLTSWIAYGKSSGTNIAGLIEDTLGTEIGFFESFAPGDQIVEAQKIWAKLDGPERAAAIKRAHTAITKRAGIFFDNEEDALTMFNALEAIAGSRVQAEEARTRHTTGQFIDLFLSLATGGAGKAAYKGIKNLGRKGTDEVAEVADDLPLLPPPTNAGTDIVPNNLPVPAAERGLATRAREVEGELVDNPVGPVREQPKLGVDPIEGEFTNVTDAKRLGGKVEAPKKGPAIKPDGPAGGKPDRVPHTGIPAFSPAQILNNVAPKQAAPILSDAIKDTTGKVAKGLGATRAQIADDTVAPLIGGGPIRRGATLAAPRISQGLSDEGSEIINLMHDAKLFTSSEIDEVRGNLGKVLDDLVSDEVTLVNKSVPFIDEAAGRVSMDYTIGAGNGFSFTSAAEAKAFITRLPSERLDNFEVLKYSAKEDAYVPYSGAGGERGDFLLRARYTHSSASGAQAEDVLKNATANPLINHVDTSVSYIKRVSEGISRLDIRQAQVGRLFKDILKPLEALRSKADLDDVWSALKAAEKNAEDFTPGQLTRMLDGSGPKMEAYRAVRRFYKAVYEVRNQQYRDLLSKKGFLSHVHTDGTTGWVKPAKNTDEVVSVWWDEAGGIVSKKSLEDRGIKLEILEGFKPRRSNAKDGTILETPYVAVREGKSNLGPLPSQVLYNKPTYLGRHLNAKYVVEEIETAIVNGKATSVGRVVAVANNPVDASRAALQGNNRRSRRAIETTETDASYLSQELSQMHDLQLLTNTKNRLDFDALDVTRQESVLSPSESLDRVRNTLSKSAVLNEWIEYNTNKWIKTYGHLIKEPGFPWGGEIKLKSELATDPDAIKELAKARKVRERIQLTSGVHDLQIGERIQQSLLGAGEWLSRAGANALKRNDANALRKIQVGALNTAAYALTKAASVNVVNKSKALAHLSFIIANPVRQLVMQSTSATMYAGVQHGAKYLATGAAGRDFAFLALAKSYKDLDPSAFNSIVDKYAKVAGVKRKDAERFFKDFEDSGTLGSVSSHQFLEHGFTAGGSYRNHAGTYAAADAPGFLGRAGHLGKGAFDTAFRTTSKYGFEAGEKANRMAAYLAVRNKHLVNGTLGNVDATDLGTEGLRLAGNMGQYSKSAFQAGALGLPFQFMSHTTRMIQYMTPNTKWTSWIASDTLSNADKAKIGVWQAALFGTGGLGLGSLFIDAAKNEGVEIDPEVQNALEEGLAGLGLEALIEGIGGSDANINISGVMGPLSGLTGDLQVVFGKGERAATPLGQTYKLLSDLATGLPVGFDDMAGAGAGAISNVGGIVSNISKIWMNPVFSVGEKFELQARDVAVLLPVVNNVLQARIMAATGEYASKYGTPVAQVTIAEALSKGLIGVGPESVSAAYDLNTELRGKRSVLLAPTHKEVSTSGKDVASFTFNAFNRLSNGQMSKQEVLDRIEASNAAVLMAYEDPTDREIYRASFRKELVRLMGNRENLSDTLVKLMASDLELSQELGWDRISTHIEKLAPSQYRDLVLKNIENIKANESGSKLKFEAEL